MPNENETVMRQAMFERRCSELQCKHLLMDDLLPVR